MAATHSCRREPQRESERALDFSFGKQPKTCSAGRRDEELRMRCKPKNLLKKKKEDDEEEEEDTDFLEKSHT